ALAVAAPAVAGAISVFSVLFVAGTFGLEDVPSQFSRFVTGDATGIMVFVPAITTFVGWKQLIAPAEHQEPSPMELWLSVAATAVLVVAGTWFTAMTREPVLDLSFVAM